MVLSKTPTRHHLAKSVKDILGAADRAEPKLRRAILEALEALQGTTADIERLVATGRLDPIMHAVERTFLPRDLIGDIFDAYADAAVATARTTAVEMRIAFNEPNRRAIQWAEQNAANLIKGPRVDKAAIRRLVTNATEQGIHPRITARQIQRNLPLMPQHQKSINRQWLKMLEDGLDPAHIDKVVGRRADKLIRYRARVIARTEALKAANMGQQLAWETASDLGLIPAGTKKIWVATGDDRTCTICAVMDGQTVSMTGNYSVTRQATGFVRSGSDFRVSGTKPIAKPHTSKTPPAHPQCRCTMILETIQAPAEPGTSAGVHEPTIMQPGSFASQADAENFLKTFGIDSDLTGVSVDNMNAIGQAVQDVGDRYPWMRDKFGTNKGLSSIRSGGGDLDIENRLRELSAAGQTRWVPPNRATGSPGGLEITLRGDIFRGPMDPKDIFCVDGSAYGTMTHELGHAAQRLLADAHGLWSGPRQSLSNDVSLYAAEIGGSGTETFAELFTVKNLYGYDEWAEKVYAGKRGAKAAADRMRAAEAVWEKQFGVTL
jgi:hypothetical protein